MPTFIAHVEFRIQAERLEDAGRRMRELAKAASRVGFELERGRIEPAPAEDDDRGGGTSYVITE
jgi:hypothetical protein